jgi:hypothetical protein
MKVMKVKKVNLKVIYIKRLTPDSRAPAKQSWHHVGPMLGLYMLDYVGLCWAYVGPCKSYVGAMFGPSMLKRS